MAIFQKKKGDSRQLSCHKHGFPRSKAYLSNVKAFHNHFRGCETCKPDRILRWSSSIHAKGSLEDRRSLSVQRQARGSFCVSGRSAVEIAVRSSRSSPGATVLYHLCEYCEVPLSETCNGELGKRMRHNLPSSPDKSACRPLLSGSTPRPYHKHRCNKREGARQFFRTQAPFGVSAKLNPKAPKPPRPDSPCNVEFFYCISKLYVQECKEYGGHDPTSTSHESGCDRA